MTPFWIAFLVSAIASLPIMKLLIAMKARQTVSSHLEGHATKQGTPTMGGFIILVGFIAASLSTDYPGRWPILILVVLFAIIGFVDDFVVPKLLVGTRGLGWKQKIAMQVVAAAVPCFMAGLSPAVIGVAVFSILFFANAYNFSDGLDGLAGSIFVAQLAGMVLLVSGMGVPTVHFIWLGALLPFLYWNAPRAKVFMGDVGSLAIGAFLGGYWFLGKLVIPESQLMPLVVGVLLWSLVMVAELLPVPLQVGAVKILKRRIFPFTPIHHAFEVLKTREGETDEQYIERQKVALTRGEKWTRWAQWPETRIVFVFAIAQFLCSMLALTVFTLLRK